MRVVSSNCGGAYFAALLGPTAQGAGPAAREQAAHRAPEVAGHEAVQQRVDGRVAVAEQQREGQQLRASGPLQFERHFSNNFNFLLASGTIPHENSHDTHTEKPLLGVHLKVQQVHGQHHDVVRQPAHGKQHGQHQQDACHTSPLAYQARALIQVRC